MLVHGGSTLFWTKRAGGNRPQYRRLPARYTERRRYHLRSYGLQVTCECRPSEALIGHNWHTDHITEDTVVLALLSNDACGPKMLGIRDQWFAVYLEGVKRVVTKLVRDGKRVIFVLPKLTDNHYLYHDEDPHSGFRWVLTVCTTILAARKFMPGICTNSCYTVNHDRN